MTVHIVETKIARQGFCRGAKLRCLEIRYLTQGVKVGTLRRKNERNFS